MSRGYIRQPAHRRYGRRSQTSRCAVMRTSCCITTLSRERWEAANTSWFIPYHKTKHQLYVCTSPRNAKIPPSILVTSITLMAVAADIPRHPSPATRLCLHLPIPSCYRTLRASENSVYVWFPASISVLAMYPINAVLLDGRATNKRKMGHPSLQKPLCPGHMTPYSTTTDRFLSAYCKNMQRWRSGSARSLWTSLF